MPLQRFTQDGNASIDANLTDVSGLYPAGTATVWAGTTLVPEVADYSSVIPFAVVFDGLPSVVQVKWVLWACAW